MLGQVWTACPPIRSSLGRTEAGLSSCPAQVLPWQRPREPVGGHRGPLRLSGKSTPLCVLLPLQTFCGCKPSLTITIFLNMKQFSLSYLTCALDCIFIIY